MLTVKIVFPEIIGDILDLIFKSHIRAPLLLSKEMLSPVEIKISLSDTIIGLPSKTISLSDLKFCIQLIFLLFIKLIEYKEPLVERKSKLFLLSIARLLSNFDTVFEG